MRAAFFRTSLGRILLARSARGIALLGFGNHDADLLAWGESIYGPLMLTPKDEELQSSAERLKAWIAEPQHACPLPIDRTHGTEFQRLVWQHLEAIPFGSTWTYQQLANTLGRPKSVRAVARACGANPVALIVPCHRVIGRDGSLRGYRWGLSTKQQLLAWEEQAGIARRAEEFDHSRGRLADAELVVG